MIIIRKALLLSLLICSPLFMTNIYAQNDDGSFAYDGSLKVAVFDPVGKVKDDILQIVREEISSVLVNRREYTVLERQLINKVLEENKFQGEGMVDASQISEIGKIMGADYVFVSTLNPLNNNFYLSCKMIEVATARIEKQSTGTTQSGINDIMQTTQQVVRRLFGENVGDRMNIGAVSSSSYGSKQPSGGADEIEMVYIERPGRRGVYISKFELTQSQWLKIERKNPSKFKGATNPVENVSLKDILNYIAALNRITGKKYRLPTEDEWLYAANGGQNRGQYEYSGSNDVNEVAWHSYNSNKRTSAVGMKMPNSIGIYDMSGNVGEWCTYDYGGKYIILGGSFLHHPKHISLFKLTRILGGKKKGYEHVGFRLVLEE